MGITEHVIRAIWDCAEKLAADGMPDDEAVHRAVEAHNHTERAYGYSDLERESLRGWRDGPCVATRD